MKEMKKETVLICDNKSIFLKMFKKILTEKFEFSESSLQFDEKNTAAKDYDHFLPQLVDALLGIEDKLNELVSAVDALEQVGQSQKKVSNQ